MTDDEIRKKYPRLDEESPFEYERRVRAKVIEQAVEENHQKLMKQGLLRDDGARPGNSNGVMNFIVPPIGAQPMGAEGDVTVGGVLVQKVAPNLDTIQRINRIGGGPPRIT
jgi:hypothetical protein